MPDSNVNRAHRKERIGVVVSHRMAKTVIVRVERRLAHPRFKKVVTRYRKLYAHDAEDTARVGDRVRIQETRPLSRLKCWRLVEVLERASTAEPAAAGQ